MKKLVAVIAVLALSFALLTGCTTSLPADLALEDIYDAVVEHIAAKLRAGGYGDEEFANEILPGFTVIDLFGEEGEHYLVEVDKADLVNGYLIKGGFLSPDQIIILEAKDGNADGIKAVLEDLKQSQYDFWQDYNPGQAAKINDTTIIIQGNFIFYATYDQAEELNQIFQGFFN